MCSFYPSFIFTGSKWHSRRKLLTPAFHFNILNDFVEVFSRQSSKLVSKLKDKANGKPFDIFPFITLCTLDIICGVLWFFLFTVFYNFLHLSILLPSIFLILLSSVNYWHYLTHITFLSFTAFSSLYLLSYHHLPFTLFSFACYRHHHHHPRLVIIPSSYHPFIFIAFSLRCIPAPSSDTFYCIPFHL